MNLARTFPLEVRTFQAVGQEGVLAHAELEGVFGVAWEVVVEARVDFAAGFGDGFQLREEVDGSWG